MVIFYLLIILFLLKTTGWKEPANAKRQGVRIFLFGVGVNIFIPLLILIATILVLFFRSI